MNPADLIFYTVLCAVAALSVAGPLLVAAYIRKEVRTNMNALLQKLDLLKGDIDASKLQIEKARAEVVGKIESLTTRVAELEAALNEGAITPEVQTALDGLKTSVDELKASAQVLDEVVPD